MILLAGIYLLIDGHICGGANPGSAVGFVAIVDPVRHGARLLPAEHGKALELAERDLAAGDTLGAEYAAVSKKLENGGKIAGAIVAITIFFMVVKP